MSRWNLKERTKICKVQIFAKQFYAYPRLTRIGVLVTDLDGTKHYLNHKPNTDWDVELSKCHVPA